MFASVTHTAIITVHWLLNVYNIQKSTFFKYSIIYTTCQDIDINGNHDIPTIIIKFNINKMLLSVL